MGKSRRYRLYFPTSTLKTVYDPCPVGYKVPLGDVFLALAKESKIDTYSEDDYWIKEGNEYGTTFYCDGAGKDNTKQFIFRILVMFILSLFGGSIGCLI